MCKIFTVRNQVETKRLFSPNVKTPGNIQINYDFFCGWLSGLSPDSGASEGSSFSTAKR
ncbi:hypothetical protein SEHO0A_00325 [Salmonella enterica subsp. houtenae str. ATCC BAA-1581]|nr:hypothetical protein SEHO0A_00325 [Salmonella enterica subsp. houtenae str. ATCC BAA-1581]